MLTNLRSYMMVIYNDRFVYISLCSIKIQIYPANMCVEYSQVAAIESISIFVLTNLRSKIKNPIE